MTRRSARTLAAVVASSTIGLGTVLGVAAPANASTVIATVYEHANYGGASANIVHPTTGFVCTLTGNDIDWSVASIPATLGSFWNDRISSFKMYAGCLATFYEDVNFQGSAYGWAGNTPWIGGAMNDRASSVKFT